MTVEFAFKKSPAYRVAYITWKGPWSDRRIQQKFDTLLAWTRDRHLRTGKWIFREPAERTWEVAIEVRGTAVPTAPIRLKTIPATSVASVVFDPDVVSSEVVYHALVDWLRWRRRDGKVRSVGGYREVYDGDPWRDPKVYARTDVQFAVRR